MPCRVDVCNLCGKYDCPGLNDSTHCIYMKVVPIKDSKESSSKQSKRSKGFDTAGALCDVISILENKYPDAYLDLDIQTRNWFQEHEKGELEKIKEEALAKLTAREKRILGLK